MAKLKEKDIKEFEEVVKPVMEFLNRGDLFHPHITVIITGTNAEIVEGILNILKDDKDG